MLVQLAYSFKVSSENHKCLQRFPQVSMIFKFIAGYIEQWLQRSNSYTMDHSLLQSLDTKLHFLF